MFNDFSLATYKNENDYNISLRVCNDSALRAVALKCVMACKNYNDAAQMLLGYVEFDAGLVASKTNLRRAIVDLLWYVKK